MIKRLTEDTIDIDQHDDRQQRENEDGRKPDEGRKYYRPIGCVKYTRRISRLGALQYEMDIGARLRLPNPGALGESEEKKQWGHRVRAGKNEPKLSKFS